MLGGGIQLATEIAKTNIHWYTRLNCEVLSVHTRIIGKPATHILAELQHKFWQNSSTHIAMIRRRLLAEMYYNVRVSILIALGLLYLNVFLVVIFVMLLVMEGL